MSYLIKYINESDKIEYRKFSDVERFVYYIYGDLKSVYDEIRPGHSLGEFNGFMPCIGGEDYCHDPWEAAYQILLNIRMYGYSDGDTDFMKHRIISFNKYDYILPQDAENLAKYLISSIYPDYITLFGVHLNTSQIHIHLGINTINYMNGNKFDVPFEKLRLERLARKWLDNHYENLENDPKLKGQYERYLFPEEATIKPTFGPGIIKRYHK